MCSYDPLSCCLTAHIYFTNSHSMAKVAGCGAADELLHRRAACWQAFVIAIVLLLHSLVERQVQADCCAEPFAPGGS